jgi:DNA end-binding protein Ku
LYSDIDWLTDGLAEGAAPGFVDGVETVPPVLLDPEPLPPGLDTLPPVDMPPLPVVPEGAPVLPELPTPPEVPLPVDPPAPLEPLDPAPEAPAAPPLPPLPDPVPPPVPCAAASAGARATTPIKDARRICFIALLLPGLKSQDPDRRRGAWGDAARATACPLRLSTAMARALWKGSISFGLVTVPIGLVSATEAREELAFNLLHRKDGSRIVQKRFCREEDVEVPWGEVVKGYQYAKDQYVVLTDEDFDKARVPATQTFEIRSFVRAGDVPDLYFETPYYVQPEGKSASKPYALLRDALAESGKIGIGSIVLRQREHLAALEPAGQALVLTTMRFAHEIRSPQQLDLPALHQGYAEKEMKLARQLMDTLSDEWKPEAFRDTYSDVLRQIIEAKVEGKEVTAPETPKRAPVTDLMEALQRSLSDRPLAKAAGRKPATPKRGKVSRKRAA